MSAVRSIRIDHKQHDSTVSLNQSRDDCFQVAPKVGPEHDGAGTGIRRNQREPPASHFLLPHASPSMHAVSLGTLVGATVAAPCPPTRPRRRFRVARRAVVRHHHDRPRAIPHFWASSLCLSTLPASTLSLPASPCLLPRSTSHLFPHLGLPCLPQALTPSPCLPPLSPFVHPVPRVGGDGRLGDAGDPATLLVPSTRFRSAGRSRRARRRLPDFLFLVASTWRES